MPTLLVIIHSLGLLVALFMLHKIAQWVTRTESRRLLMGDVYTDKRKVTLRRQYYVWQSLLAFNTFLLMLDLYLLFT